MPEKGSKINPHAGHRDRLRSQFILGNGGESLPDHSVLELLLFYAVPRRDTNPLAHSLLARFGSFDKVLEADHEQLMSVDGMSFNSAVLIEMMIPIFKRYMRTSCSNDSGRSFYKTSELLNFTVSQFIGETEERVIMLCFNANAHLVNVSTVCNGGINSVGFDLRRIVEVAIGNRASSVILAHNHPNGLAVPSSSDVESTKRIAEMLRQIKVKLTDHIIVAGNRCCRMSEYCGG